MSDPSNTSTSKESSARGAPPFEHRYTTDADPQIHYVHVPSTTSSSDGPNSPVMLVHGFPQSWRAWGPVAGLLADEHSLLIPDLRGFGDSARPLTGYGTTVGGGEDLMAVLDHSGIERVTLVGHDLGAVVAYFFAVNHPERVDRLVFVEAALPTSDQSTWPTLWHWPFLTRPDLAKRSSPATSTRSCALCSTITRSVRRPSTRASTTTRATSPPQGPPIGPGMVPGRRPQRRGMAAGSLANQAGDACPRTRRRPVGR